jgi:rfaE bifunctional protein kinase chain/domain
MSSIPDILRLDRLQAFLEGFPSLQIAVLGDFALDTYWHADMTRASLSRETPLFPRPVIQESYSPGAGGNVAHNLKALGAGKVMAFTILGQDHWAAILSEEIARRGVVTTEILRAPGRRTNVYVKPILHGYNSQQEDARLDFENDSPIPVDVEDVFIKKIEQALPELQAVVLTDQFEMYGVITERVRKAVCELARDHPEKIFLVDSRRWIREYPGCYWKPNRIEAAQALGLTKPDASLTMDEMREIGKRLSERSRRPVFLTLGGDGVLVCTPDCQEGIAAARVRPPHDPVGAGDAFLSALAAALCLGASPCEAGAFASLAAAVTVEKLLQTGTASPEEILLRYHMTQKAEKL